MSSQTFEILCPICRSVVPPDAPGCPTCAQTKRRRGGDPARGATRRLAGCTSPLPHARIAPPDLAALPMQDYHRVVRATYQATERTATGGSRIRAYLPFVLLRAPAVVGAAMLYGHICNRAAAEARSRYPWIETMSGMMRMATMFVILIIGLIAGPAVSL